MKYYDEYAVLDSQIKALSAQKDELRDAILKDMVESGEESIDTAVGKFTVTKLKTWTYPEKIVEVGEQFKTLKAKAESTGDATYVEKESLRFTQIKL